MSFYEGDAGKSFALYAGLAAVCAAISLFRDGRANRTAPFLGGSTLAPIGIVSLAVTFATAATPPIQLLTGALLVCGLAIVAIAPRSRGRLSAGRQVGIVVTWLAIAIALSSAFISSGPAPNLPT